MSVVVAPRRVSYSFGMITHDELLAELVRQLDDGRLRPKTVADALGLPSSRVAEMRRRARRIQQREMPIVAALLGLTGDTISGETRIARTVKIPHLGRVAQGIWLEETSFDPEHRQFVDYDMAPGDPSADHLFSVTPEGKSMNLAFPAGMKLICRRVPFGNGTFRSGDFVIVERTAHDLREMTCKQVEVDESGTYWLRSLSDQPQFQEPWRIGAPDSNHHDDMEIRIIGKVIRGVLDFEGMI